MDRHGAAASGDHEVDIVKLPFSFSRFHVIGGVMLAGFCTGFLLLMPLSTNLVRYLFWNLTPAAVALEGSVPSGDADIHYVSYGSGPAVLLLHGGLSNRLIWFSQIPWLVASGRQVVLMDTRGHGGSGLGHDDLSYHLFAADAVAILNKLDIQQTDVIGWSDGGNTALLLGRYWPQRIKRLITISANFNPSGLITNARQGVHDRRNGLRYWLNRWWTGAGDRLLELEDRIERLWQTRPNLQAADVQKITAPTLVIVGQSDMVTISHSRLLAELLPHGTLAVIPGGHSTPVTHPGRINRLIAEFLEIASSG
jgi:pimeloyl-ACP methyl ester carboxylesterase